MHQVNKRSTKWPYRVYILNKRVIKVRLLDDVAVQVVVDIPYEITVNVRSRESYEKHLYPEDFRKKFTKEDIAEKLKPENLVKIHLNEIPWCEFEEGVVSCRKFLELYSLYHFVLGKEEYIKPKTLNKHIKKLTDKTLKRYYRNIDYKKNIQKQLNDIDI